MINRIEQSKLLVVEGTSEVHLFSALRRSLGLSGIQIVNARSKDNIRNTLLAVKSHTDFRTVTSLGVVRDADANAQSAFQSVRDSFRSLGLPVPVAPLQTAGNVLKTIVLILPYGANSGILEDVCLASVAQDPVIPCVDDYIKCIQGTATVQPKNMSKSRAHAFLSSREDPEVQLGIAAEKGYWNFDHNAFDPLKDLLRML